MNYVYVNKKKGAMMNTKQNITEMFHENPIRRNDTTKKFKIVYFNIAKIISLLILFILASSHESKNPKIGNSDVEFYLFEMAGIIEDNLKQNIIKPSDDTAFSTQELVYNFYKIRNYYPAWTINFNTLPCTDSLLSELRNARIYGLEPVLYKVSYIDTLIQKMQLASDDSVKLNYRKELEVQLTTSFIEFSTNISIGLTYNRESLEALKLRESIPFILNNGINKKMVKTTVLSLQPRNIEYTRLITALGMFLENVDINNETIKLPSPSDSVLYQEAVKNALIRLGYLSPENISDTSIVNTAIVKFKKLHGLQSKTLDDKEVQQCLSRSTKSMYVQLALNIDRLRKTRHDGTKYVMVNIPSYEMKIVDHEKEEASFIVVVGKPTSPTPELSSKIQTVVANPFWTVPKSITFDELVPRIKKDSTYLERNNFFLIDNKESKVDPTLIDWENINSNNFDYWIRQKNTRGNALGVVKFLFPNNYQVYIHDTPSKKYFTKERRAYSHGCVRLQNPELFAKYLVEKHYKNEEKISIDNVLKTGERTTISLDDPLDVHIRYYTCAADENLDIHFYYDVYQKDKEEIDRMFAL